MERATQSHFVSAKRAPCKVKEPSPEKKHKTSPVFAPLPPISSMYISYTQTRIRSDTGQHSTEWITFTPCKVYTDYTLCPRNINCVQVNAPMDASVYYCGQQVFVVYLLMEHSEWNPTRDTKVNLVPGQWKIAGVFSPMERAMAAGHKIKNDYSAGVHDKLEQVRMFETTVVGPVLPDNDVAIF